MANLNIAERRLPQDGRIRIRVGEKDVDIRVPVVPPLMASASCPASG
jgi:type II secretory ATPase GspE/PulE/Tfp pilus assembly ATPase PilB-like protein